MLIEELILRDMILVGDFFDFGDIDFRMISGDVILRRFRGGEF